MEEYAHAELGPFNDAYGTMGFKGARTSALKVDESVAYE
jgi:hypothetical protein